MLLCSLSIVDRDIIVVDSVSAFTFCCLAVVLLMPLVDLVGRSSILVTVPTMDYFLFVVLTPAVGTLFVDNSAPVPTPATTLDRGKGFVN